MSALTIEQLTQQLARYPQTARVLINNQAGLPFNYAVYGVMGEHDFDVAHLFDKDAAPPPPAPDCVYLLITIETV